MNNADMPAMPQTGTHEDGVPNDCNDWGGSGLTKREHFAGLALQGLLSKHGDNDYPVDCLAKLSVVYADALLSELEK